MNVQNADSQNEVAVMKQELNKTQIRADNLK